MMQTIYLYAALLAALCEASIATVRTTSLKLTNTTLTTAQASAPGRPAPLRARLQGPVSANKCYDNDDCHRKDPTKVCRRDAAGKCGQPRPGCLGVCIATCRTLKCSAGAYCTTVKSPQEGAVACMPNGMAS